MSSDDGASVLDLRHIPGYLQGYYYLVQRFIALIAKEPKSTALIAAIVNPKKEEGEVVSYFRAMMENQLVVAILVVISVALMACSLFGGFFFVLLRMVGAFGGRKVQDITSRYSLVLRTLTICMLVLMSVTVACLICMWGSVDYLTFYSVKSRTFLRNGIKMVERYLVDTIADMVDVTSELTQMKDNLRQEIYTIEQRYRTSIKTEATEVLKACHLPSPAMMGDLKGWSSQLTPPPPGLVDNINNLTGEIQPIFDTFESVYSRMINYFSRTSVIKQEHDISASQLNRKAVDLRAVSDTVNKSIPLPEISVMGLLGRLSLTDTAFKYLEGYGTMVCSVAALLVCVVFVSMVVGVSCHSEAVPPNKRGFLSNQAGIMIVIAMLVMWLFCSAMMPSAILFMMGGVIAEAYICNPYRHHKVQFLDDVIGTLYVHEGPEYAPDVMYNSTMKPSWVISHCPSNPSLLNLTRNQDIKGLENVANLYNPPKYYKWLEDGTAFKYDKYNTEFASRTTFAGREAMREVSEAITSLSSPPTITTPISTDTARAYAADILLGFQTFTAGSASAQWDKMDECVTKEMNARYFHELDKDVAPLIAQLSNVTDRVTNELGRCKPISDFYNDAFILFCDASLNSMNGFWVSLWLVTFLFSCIIVIGLKLSKYFMRMDDYTYGGIELEESVDEDDGMGHDDSVSYAPSASGIIPEGKFKWRRPRLDAEGKFMKFEIHPYHMPDMEAVEAGESDDELNLIDVGRLQTDKFQEFVPENLMEDLMRAKMVLQRAPRPPIQEQQNMLRQLLLQPPTPQQPMAPTAPRRV
ncbi:uncharacterized protein LOC135388602 isoform X3 [Ornithodoros turicata]|uniref:uncharacterized protein LOC135388602 isoform X3 n=1 Tax=Ornithodoros turicata TaxID=34597 RepID=UPI003138CADB